jgi:hypothetical protein
LLIQKVGEKLGEEVESPGDKRAQEEPEQAQSVHLSGEGEESLLGQEKKKFLKRKSQRK